MANSYHDQHALTPPPLSAFSWPDPPFPHSHFYSSGFMGGMDMSTKWVPQGAWNFPLTKLEKSNMATGSSQEASGITGNKGWGALVLEAKILIKALLRFLSACAWVSKLISASEPWQKVASQEELLS